MGFIAAYETPEGRRYKVRYRKPDHSEGAKRGFTSKREAKLWLASVEVDMSRNSYVDPARARITVEVWMRTWLGTRADLRTTTRERVEGIIDRDIVPALGRYPLGGPVATAAVRSGCAASPIAWRRRASGSA